MNKSLNYSLPQFPYLQSGNDDLSHCEDRTYDAKCSEKHWPMVSLYHVVATVTTYFTYCVSMDYSLGEKGSFFVAEEMVENICPDVTWASPPMLAWCSCPSPAQFFSVELSSSRNPLWTCEVSRTCSSWAISGCLAMRLLCRSRWLLPCSGAELRFWSPS